MKSIGWRVVVRVFSFFVVPVWSVGSSVFELLFVFCILMQIYNFILNQQIFFSFFFVVLELKRCFIVFWKCNFFCVGMILGCIFVLFFVFFLDFGA